METPISLAPVGLIEFEEGASFLGISPPGVLARRPSVVKRAMDLVGSAMGLVLLAPAMLLVAALIRSDSKGPIFFRQVRVGRSGRPFRIYKFRTMVSDAEERLAKLEAYNEASGGVLFKMKDDPRVTRLGRFLRRSSLDELPQLINVLRGEMSLIGPRPLQLRDCERLAAFDPASFASRLGVLPGLTGLAQVSGRRELDPARILEFDLRYARDWSLGLDLSILCRTVAVVLQGHGAD